MKFSKRHVFKTFTWRLIGTLDTFILSWLITGDSTLGLKISGLELITKTLFYYFHELFWFKSRFINANKRHVIKTFTWRFIGTLDTILIAWLISANPLSGLKIGTLEIFSKMLLYFGHEKLWYRINYGLDLRQRGAGMMKDLLNTAITAALEAGKSILEIYYLEEFDVEIKGDKSPLTKADVASHHKIVDYLEKTGIPILSEEGKAINFEERKNWRQLWIVDPIDGTKEFIKRNGEFTVNIALVRNQCLIIGVIFVPVTGELYFSSKENGSFKVSVDTENYDVDTLILKGKKLPLKSEEKVFTIVASRSHMSTETNDYVEKMKLLHGDVNLISKGSSLKLCMVAEGKADCYPRFAPTMEWDTAAGQAICEHAGFKVIDFKSKTKIKYNKENLLNNYFLVS